MNYNKRLLRDIRVMETYKDNDFIIDYDPENFTVIFAYIKAPKDSLYSLRTTSLGLLFLKRIRLIVQRSSF